MGGEKFAHGFFGVIPPDAGDENGSGWCRSRRAAAIFRTARLLLST